MLDRFRNSDTWIIGRDAPIAIVTVAIDGGLTTAPGEAPMQALILRSDGLIYNMPLQGIEISPLDI